MSTPATDIPVVGWRALLTSRPVRQSAVYAASGALSMGLGAIGKAVLAHALTPAQFGTFAFGLSFLTFTALFFEFGLFTPAARRIARSTGTEQAELVGAATAIFAPIGLLFCLAVFGLSFAVKPVFHVSAGGALRIVAPLSFAYALEIAALQIAQGADRVGAYSVATMFGQAAFVVALVVTAALTDMSATVALGLNTAGLLIGLSSFIRTVRPRFSSIVAHGNAIISDARDWGFQLYIGRVLSIGTYNMDVLMVAGFTNSKTVGFYVLAGTLAQASGLPIAGLGTALFAPLARAKKIEPRWLLTAWCLGGVGVVGTVVLAPLVIKVVFTAAYRPAVALALPLALAQAVRGVTSVYNSYLSAHGWGRELRNCGLILTASNLAFNFGLIPWFGAMGAAWASFAALLLNYGGHLYYYRRVAASDVGTRGTGGPP
jgi:O-antigen/teichoic acid export membrane protein